MPVSEPDLRADAEDADHGMSTELDRRRARRAAGELARLVGRMADDARDSGRAAATLRRPLGRAGNALSASVRAAQGRALASRRGVTDPVVQLATNLRIRDLAALQAAHGGLSGDDLADALVRTASRATAAIGAAGGALAAAEFAAPPALLGLPAQIVAEMFAVVAVELRLIGELHVVHGRAVVGSPRQRALALVTAWARRRGVDPLAGSVAGAFGLAARRELRTRVVRLLGRNLTTFAPFLAGAVAGAEINRRETVKLGERVLADLRRGHRRGH